MRMTLGCLAYLIQIVISVIALDTFTRNNVASISTYDILSTFIEMNTVTSVRLNSLERNKINAIQSHGLLLSHI